MSADEGSGSFRIPKTDLREVVRQIKDALVEEANDAMQRDGNPVIPQA